MKRRIIPLLAAVLALLCLCVPVLAAVDLNDPQFVVDDAGVLSPEMEEKIVQANESLYYDCSGAEFVVVTVKYPPLRSGSGGVCQKDLRFLEDRGRPGGQRNAAGALYRRDAVHS